MVASDEDTTPTYALDALVANLSIDATPVGNIGGDAGGDAREGRTAQEAERKFLAEFGLTSSTGANASNDKEFMQNELRRKIKELEQEIEDLKKKNGKDVE